MTDCIMNPCKHFFRDDGIWYRRHGPVTDRLIFDLRAALREGDLTHPKWDWTTTPPTIIEAP